MNAAGLITTWGRHCRSRDGGGFRVIELVASAREAINELNEASPAQWLALALLAIDGTSRSGASAPLIYHTLEAILGIPKAPGNTYDLERLVSAQRRQSLHVYGANRPIKDVVDDLEEALDYAETQAKEGPRWFSLSHLELWCVILLIVLEGAWRSHDSVHEVCRGLFKQAGVNRQEAIK